MLISNLGLICDVRWILCSFQVVWSSKISQCVNQSDIGVPALCSAKLFSKGLCSTFETGFQQKQIPISFQKPTCPNDYYVLGHLALQMAVRPRPLRRGLYSRARFPVAGRDRG